MKYTLVSPGYKYNLLFGCGVLRAKGCLELESTQVGSNQDPSPRPPIHVGSEATRVKSCKSQRDCFAARLKKAYKQAMSKWEDEYECPTELSPGWGGSKW